MSLNDGCPLCLMFARRENGAFCPYRAVKGLHWERIGNGMAMAGRCASRAWEWLGM